MYVCMCMFVCVCVNIYFIDYTCIRTVSLTNLQVSVGGQTFYNVLLHMVTNTF
jgi:hypothetical protein